MTSTYTRSLTSTFTRTHARYLASKVAADLRQMQLFYGKPPDDEIDAYLVELTELLAGGYIDSVDYGFRNNNGWIVALKYKVQSDGTMSTDDRSGRVRPNANIIGARWYSYLRTNSRFGSLTSEERQRIQSSLPFERTSENEPQLGNGVWITDKTYSRNGTAVQRHSFRRL